MGRILIIDDDSMIRQMIKRMVVTMGHEVDTASDLEHGAQIVRSGDFDLVFLDVQLPDGSGLESLSRIQASPSSPEIIIITGFGDPDGAEMAIRSGAWDLSRNPLPFPSSHCP